MSGIKLKTLRIITTTQEVNSSGKLSNMVQLVTISTLYLRINQLELGVRRLQSLNNSFSPR